MAEGNDGPSLRRHFHPEEHALFSILGKRYPAEVDALCHQHDIMTMLADHYGACPDEYLRVHAASEDALLSRYEAETGERLR